MSLSRSTERQAGNDGKTVVIDWFSKKKRKKLNQHFLCIFIFLRVFIFANDI